VAFFLEALPDEARHLSLVLDDQDAHLGLTISVMYPPVRP